MSAWKWTALDRERLTPSVAGAVGAGLAVGGGSTFAALAPLLAVIGPALLVIACAHHTTLQRLAAPRRAALLTSGYITDLRRYTVEAWVGSAALTVVGAVVVSAGSAVWGLALLGAVGVHALAATWRLARILRALSPSAVEDDVPSPS